MHGDESLRYVAASDHDRTVPEPFAEDRLSVLRIRQGRVHEARGAIDQQQSADRRPLRSRPCNHSRPETNVVASGTAA